MADILTMGMDVGSTTSKCLILRGGKDIVASALIPAGTGTSGPRHRALASWPPMSMTVFASPSRAWAPRAWQLSSLTV